MAKLEKYCIGNQTGRPFLDHYDELVATSNPGYLILSLDFSSFDQTEQENNCRRWEREGVLNALIELGYKGVKWGDYDDMIQLVHLLWGKQEFKFWFAMGEMSIPKLEQQLKDKKNKKGAPKKYSAEKFIRLIKHRASGEYNTYPANTIVNEADDTTFQEKLFLHNLFSSSLAFIKSKYLGDDRLTLFARTGPWTLEKHKAFAELLEENAKDNQLITNAIKSDVSLTMANFLKVTNMHGGEMQRTSQIQILSAEKLNKAIGSIGVLRSYMMILKTAVDRGYDPKFVYRLLLSTAMFKLNVVSRDEKLKATNLPLAAMFTPIGLGGVGMWKGKFGFGANLDMAISLTATGQFRDAINKYAYSMSQVKTNFRQEIARALTRADVFLDGQKNPFMIGVKWTTSHLLKEKLSASKKAEIDLGDIAKKVGDLSYQNSPKLTMSTRFEGSPDLRSVHISENHLVIEKLLHFKMPPNVPDVMMERFKWMHESIDSYKQLEPMKPLCNVSPLANANPIVHHIINCVGVGVTASERDTDPGIVFRELLTDRYFPRSVTAERLMSIITMPDILHSRENILNTLVMIGAEPTKAAVISSNIHQKRTGFTKYSNLAGASLLDDLGRRLDLSDANFDRMITVYGCSDPLIKSYVQSVFLSIALNQNKLCRYQVNANSKVMRYDRLISIPYLSSLRDHLFDIINGALPMSEE